MVVTIIVCIVVPLYSATLFLFMILQENRFSKCDTCVKLKLEKKGCLDKEQQLLLQKELNQHLDKVEYVFTQCLCLFENKHLHNFVALHFATDSDSISSFSG